MNYLKLTLVLLLLSSAGFAQQQTPSSKVVFVRTFKGFGWTVGYNLFKGKKTKLTRIKPQTVAVMEMPAELTQVWAKTEVRRSVDLDLQAHTIYFVECSVGFGWLLAHPELKLISLSRFEQLYADKSYVRRQLKKQGYDTIDELISSYKAQLAIK